MQKLEKILHLFDKLGFLQRVVNNNNNFKTGPIGILLEQNLRNEWYNSMIINRDNTVFLSNDSFVNTYEYAKKICMEYVPFGIAEELSLENAIKFNNYLLEDKNTMLQTTIFVSPVSSIHFFHEWQRHRKIWWRKVYFSYPDLLKVN